MWYKKFLVSWLISIIIFPVFGLCFLKFVCGPQYVDDYNGAINDKVARLISIQEPKIILIGNSNVAFGINSAMMEKELQMPVVNLGLHGGLGLRFHENMAKYNINKGDILVILHSHYEANKIADHNLAWITVELNRQLWEMIEPDEYIGMMKAFPGYVVRAIKKWLLSEGDKRNEKIENSYCRKAFNEYGDVVFKPESGHFNPYDFFAKDENEIKAPMVDSECVERLNKLYAELRIKKAYLIVGAYPIAYGKYAKYDKHNIEIFEDEFRKKLKCEIVSNFTDYLFPYDYFYDTTLHLTKEGADYRTKLLIGDIKRWKALRQDII